ncbi:MAG: GntR family transcriptional regulator [Synergistetes bacterium]|nr:GntR family transcriptional regulator [Synergistota bacterium]
MVIQRRSLKVEVLERLKELVIGGTYLPGKKLVIEEIAREFGVSITPVREALHHLAAQGFVELQPHRGFVVKELGKKEIEDLMELRLCLEKLGARLFIQRNDKGCMEELEGCVRGMRRLVESGSVDDMVVANSKFHRIIIEGSGNKELSNVISLLGEKLHRVRILSLHAPNRLKESFKEHMAIFDAIVSKDIAAAELAVEEHIRNITKTIMGRIEQGD